MTNDVEQKETITFDEFRSWLVGLIRGKRGAIPDLEDWKHIKRMMDKVVPDEKIVPPMMPSDPIFPLTPAPYNPKPWDVPPGVKPYDNDPTKPPHYWIYYSTKTTDGTAPAYEQFMDAESSVCGSITITDNLHTSVDMSVDSVDDYEHVFATMFAGTNNTLNDKTN